MSDLATTNTSMWAMAHERSQQLAAQAEDAMRRAEAAQDLQGVADARLLYTEAGLWEAKAMEALPSCQTRTFGITAVSAISLYCKGAAQDNAMRIAIWALAHEGLPKFARTQIEELAAPILASRPKPEGSDEIKTPKGGLIDGVERSREHPETFAIPGEMQRTGLVAGDYCKIGVEEAPGGYGERFWVMIVERRVDGYVGRVCNDLVMGFHGLCDKDLLAFGPRHVLAIDDA